MGRSIFWKTREMGLPSYSKICTLWVKSNPKFLTGGGGGIVSSGTGFKVDPSIGLPMVNVLESTLEWT
jgi:hypothetical protein